MDGKGQTGGGRRLSDPPSLPKRKGLASSIEVLAAALRFLGVDGEPSWLASTSGIAFRNYWPVRDGAGAWDLDLPLAFALDPLALAAESCGIRLLRYRDMPASLVWQFIAQALSRKQPALLRASWGAQEDDVLVFGCEREGARRVLIVLTPWHDAPLRLPLLEEDDEASGIDGTEAPRMARPAAPRAVPQSAERRAAVPARACISLLERLPRHRVRSREDTIHHALRRAARLGTEGLVRLPMSYASGIAAYRAMIEALALRGAAPGAREAAARYERTEGPLPAGRFAAGAGGESAAAASMHRMMAALLDRTLEALRDARFWAARFVDQHGSPWDIAPAAQAFREEAEALAAVVPLWQNGGLAAGAEDGGAESAGGRSGGNGADPWEQTTRAVRAAAEAYERAIAILQERVPPVEQELQEDGSEEDGAGGEQDGGVAGG